MLVLTAAAAVASAFGPIGQQHAAAARDALTLLLLPCNASSPTQHFTVDNGKIGVITPTPNPMSACLCAPTSGAAGPLSMETCEGGPPLHAYEVGFNFSGAAPAAIPWVPNNAPPASGLCVTAVGPHAPPEMRPCSAAASSTQTWRLTADAQLAIADPALDLCFAVAPPPPPSFPPCLAAAKCFSGA